jgi:tRNA-dihydrouridine synthase B
MVDGIQPRCVQIAGGDPETVAEAARRHWQDGADIIDINFGCPAKKVCKKAAGSQLLRDEGLVAAIVAATVAAVPVPVTVKMRTGWSPERRNGVDVARIVQEEGAAAVTVHGRTRACRFEGRAEYETVAEIKSRLRIPVFANGDIDTREKAERIMLETGVDGVMIGRAALGAPWLPGLIASPGREEPGTSERWTIVREHVQAMHEFYGEAGVRIARKHVQWYLARMTRDGDAARRLGRGFNALECPQAQLDFLDCRAEALAA